MTARLTLAALALALLAWSLYAPITLGLDLRGASVMLVAPRDPEELEAAQDHVRRALDTLGIEADVRVRADDIEVTLPGMDERGLSALESELRPTTLELREVLEDGSDLASPVQREMLVGAPIVTVKDVRDARVFATEGVEAGLLIVEFTRAAGDRIRVFTAAHVGERVAIVIDGAVLMAPVIHERIPDGMIAITMGASPDAEDPHRLAVRLRSAGVAIEVRSRATIHSSLGERLGRPLLGAWAGAALLAAIAATIRPHRFAIAVTLALLGPLFGLAVLLYAFDGTFTSMAYVGAACAVPAAVAIVMTGLRREPTGYLERLALAWPGWIVAGATFVLANLVFASFLGPPRGASVVTAAAALAVALLAPLALTCSPLAARR